MNALLPSPNGCRHKFEAALSGGRRAGLLASSTNGRKCVESHAYREYRHVAQSFTLPHSDGTRHDDLIRRARVRHARALSGEEAAGEGLVDTTSGDPMQEVLPEGGVIRKLWIGETAKYREHVLRLDPESRRSRFAGGVSDDFIR